MMGVAGVRTVAGGSVAETYLVDVPGLGGEDFALLSAAARRTTDRYGQDSAERLTQVIEETRVLQGRFRVAMGLRGEYGKCPAGDHWAGVVQA
jgi:hypothetical protein